MNSSGILIQQTCVVPWYTRVQNIKITTYNIYYIIYKKEYRKKTKRNRLDKELKRTTVNIIIKIYVAKYISNGYEFNIFDKPCCRI